MINRRMLIRPQKGRDVIEWAEWVIDEIQRLQPIQGTGIKVEPTAAGQIISQLAAPVGASRLFYTTSSITAATRTGTTVADSVLTLGSGTARICVDSADPTLIPDANASDETIYNDLNGTIAANQFVFCNPQPDGKWIITIAWCV